MDPITRTKGMENFLRFTRGTTPNYACQDALVWLNKQIQDYFDDSGILLDSVDQDKSYELAEYLLGGLLAAIKTTDSYKELK